jgi:hypothetical protein
VTIQTTTVTGRAFAEQLMQDTCTITRADAGTPVFNETTGAYTSSAPTTVYTGPCRVKPRNLADRVVDAGEQAVSLWPFQVSIPFAATDVELDDLVTVTASVDPSLVGRELRVRSVTRGTFVTARRLECEEQE